MNVYWTALLLGLLLSPLEGNAQGPQKHSAPSPGMTAPSEASAADTTYFSGIEPVLLVINGMPVKVPPPTNQEVDDFSLNRGRNEAFYRTKAAREEAAKEDSKLEIAKQLMRLKVSQTLRNAGPDEILRTLPR